MKTYKTAVVGAHGYSGREVARLLLAHPQAELSAVFARDSEWNLADELPELSQGAVPTYNPENLATMAEQFDVIFLATPADVSMKLAPLMLKQGVKVIDLSGGFRLEAQQYPQWYKLSHTAEDHLPNAQYGLSPWWLGSDDKPQLIANPGCYATTVLMALLPLLKAKLIDPNSIIVDAKSGLTGAGRSAKKNLLYSEMHSDFYPYKIGEHQHMPEIDKAIADFIQVAASPLMITHLLPIKRGISASIYADFTADNIVAVTKAYNNAYGGYNLVKFAEIKNDKQDLSLLSLNKVVGSARTHIGYKIVGGKLYVVSTLDNLMKGAASQAIENFNYLIGLPVETGLKDLNGIL